MTKLYKLIVNTPVTHADAVRKAMGDAGAGCVGNYSHCSFAVHGTGRFIPNDKANPHIGAAGQLELVDEEQIQVDVAADKLANVINAMKSAHPYEEIGFEVYEQVDWKNL